eukprot:TRINITY_DN24764_c0_g1_i1.p1 TRINITY_DN24764_c0_g1~~TRINITY_DN24764_c0_g1_i1.p1  ORF type:complete len:149 (-),score=18.73 TRINITY_DN24764_c0_g1_i1:600-1046(-)
MQSHYTEQRAMLEMVDTPDTPSPRGYPGSTVLASGYNSGSSDGSSGSSQTPSLKRLSVRSELLHSQAASLVSNPSVQDFVDGRTETAQVRRWTSWAAHASGETNASDCEAMHVGTQVSSNALFRATNRPSACIAGSFSVKYSLIAVEV